MSSIPATSGLSAGESLLVRDAGFEPAGLVMGSAVYSTGLRGRYPEAVSVAHLTGSYFRTLFAGLPAEGGEVDFLSRAVHSARASALVRLEEDARGLGADGVIGVRAEVSWDSWAHGALECVLTGTAVRRIGAPGDLAGSGSGNGPGSAPGGSGADGSADRRPFTCGLSGGEFWALLRAGYRVRGFVMGYCAWAVEGEYSVSTRELPSVTRAVYRARERTMDQIRSQAGKLRAKGIVGVRLDGLDGLSQLPEGRILEFRATGTAIVPDPGAAPADPPPTDPPVMVLPVGG